MHNDRAWLGGLNQAVELQAAIGGIKGPGILPRQFCEIKEPERASELALIAEALNLRRGKSQEAKVFSGSWGSLFSDAAVASPQC